MSLNWEMPEEFFKKKNHLMYTEKDDNGNCRVQVELECLIFSCMTIQYNLTGEMTDEKLREISRRINLLSGQEMLMTWHVSDEELHKKGEINLESVIRYWGLDTNVSHLSATEWNKYFLKISQTRDWEWNNELTKAKQLASEDITQPHRELALLKAKNAKVDNPSPSTV